MATATFRKFRFNGGHLAALAAVGAAFLVGGATGYSLHEQAASPAALISAPSGVEVHQAAVGSVDRGSVRRLGANAPGFAEQAQPGLSVGGSVSAGTSVCDGQACITSGPITSSSTSQGSAVDEPTTRRGGNQI